jgi:hypothetical protein
MTFDASKCTDVEIIIFGMRKQVWKEMQKYQDVVIWSII